MTELPEHIRLGRDKWRVTLKKTIDDNCISESKLAQKLNISAQHLHDIINGEKYCSRKTFKKINDALKIDARYYYWRNRRSDSTKPTYSL